MRIPVDDVRAACPLFQRDRGGSIPTSAVQLEFKPIPLFRALALNDAWHSRLPKITNSQGCFSFCAEYEDITYAVAIWGRPVARAYNDSNYIELRRMAIVDEAPKYTATRMLGWMLRHLRRTTGYVKAISYQDTEVHNGTIYKASNWKPITASKDTWNRPNTKRIRNTVLVGPKIRWEYNLKKENIHAQHIKLTR